jgi:hypothetical protein
MTGKSFYILSFGFAFSTLNYKFSSTTVENPLQIHPFLCKTNPILKSHPAVNVDIKKRYENISNWTLGENEPKTNPIYRGVASGQAGSKPIFVSLAVFIAYNRRRMLVIE